MNLAKQFTILAAFTAIGFGSCTKKSTSTPTPTPTPTTKGITFKADGTSVTCDSAKATLYTLGVSPFNRMIDVYGFKGGNTVIEMHFHPKAGTYPADKTFTNSWLTYANTTQYFDSKSGSLKLTKCDTTGNVIEASFEFVGENPTATSTVNITDGTINLDKITKH